MVLVAAKFHLELSPPGVEEFLRVGGEAEERALLRGELFRLDAGRVKAGDVAVDRERASPRIDVRPPIDVAPPGERIGEDGELKALNQAVIAAAGEGLLQVGIKRPRLDAAEDRDARCLDAQRTAAEAV